LKEKKRVHETSFRQDIQLNEVSEVPQLLWYGTNRVQRVYLPAPPPPLEGGKILMNQSMYWRDR
jgi:hypothetical protein